jgi:hypothetical protein
LIKARLNLRRWFVRRYGRNWLAFIAAQKTRRAKHAQYLDHVDSVLILLHP